MKKFLTIFSLILISLILGIIQFCVLVFMTFFLLPFWKFSKSPKVKRFVVRLFISIDQFFNTILLGNEDETISARMARKPNCMICKILCWILDKIDANHCQTSLENERK